LASAYDVGADLEMIGSAVAADTDVEPGSAEFSLILAIVGVLVQEPRNLDALAQGSTPEPACYETLIDIAEAYPESPAPVVDRSVVGAVCSTRCSPASLDPCGRQSKPEEAGGRS